MRRFRALLGRSETISLPIATGFTSLAEELVQEILKYLRWPTDFYVLSLVCRTLCRHATPELYATLAISYYRPERINALLALLGNDPQRANYVKILLFDEDVKSIGPNLQSHGKWPPDAYRRELTDGWYSDSPNLQSINNYPNRRCHMEIARRLHFVLPVLHNLQRVVMRSLHPRYKYPGAFGKISSTNTPVPTSTPLPELDPAGGIWKYIFHGSLQVTEVYVNGILGRNLEHIPFLKLTTVGISALFHRVDGHTDVARLWNAALASAVNLKTLAMVDVELAPDVLHGLFFPFLRSLELYMVYLEPQPHDNGSTVFIDFLYRHSDTLQILALACPVWGSIDHTTWLSDVQILRALHTLRINHTMALLLTINEITKLPGSTHGEIHARKTKILLDFIRHRPNILDVGISSLKRPEADEFAQYLDTTRPMRNLFIGEKVEQSVSSRACCTDQFWGYGHEAWAFYELFSGLAITQSGYRPKLPQPSPLKLWKKIFS